MSDNIVSIQTEVLVIGGGIGGCRAAIRARELGSAVLLVDKATISRSGASMYAHSHLAPPPMTRVEMEIWLRAMAEDSGYLIDQKWAEILLQDAPKRLEESIAWGVPYERQANGQLQYSLVRGHVEAQSVGVDGMEMLEVYKKRAISTGVQLIENLMITGLLTTDGQLPTSGSIIGAVGLHRRTGSFYVIEAKAVILATGPFIPKMRFTYCDHLTGEALAAAVTAGAETAGFEFAVYSRFGYWERKFQTPGQAKLQGYGAKIVNALGEDIMERHNPVGKALLASLTHISAAVAAENMEGRGPCYFDMRHFGAAEIASLRKCAPMQIMAFEQYGIDIRQHLVETNPCVGIGSPNNSGGGVMIDTDCATTLDGLFGVGSVTCSPCMMSGRFGSTPSTFAGVSGYRAGEAAAQRCGRLQTRKAPYQEQIEMYQKENFAPMLRQGNLKPYDLFYQINSTLNKAQYTLFKNEQRMDAAIQYVNQVKATMLPQVTATDIHELVKALEVKGFIDLVELHFLAAKARKESRDPHFRVDFFARDYRNWLQWVITKVDSSGPTVELRPLPLDDYPLQPLDWEPTPITIQVPHALAESN